MIQLLKWKKILHECRAPILFKMYSFLLYIALFHFAAAKVLDDHQSKSGKVCIAYILEDITGT